MFDDIKYLIKDADLPDAVRLALAIVTKAASWLPWVFVGAGLLMSQQFFLYWLAFFMFAEGALLATMIYILVLIVRNAFAAEREKLPAEDRHSSSDFSDAALKGVIGNFAFYLFILVVFVVLKAMGIFDALFKNVLQTLS